MGSLSLDQQLLISLALWSSLDADESHKLLSLQIFITFTWGMIDHHLEAPASLSTPGQVQHLCCQAMVCGHTKAGQKARAYRNAGQSNLFGKYWLSADFAVWRLRWQVAGVPWWILTVLSGPNIFPFPSIPLSIFNLLSQLAGPGPLKCLSTPSSTPALTRPNVIV